MEMHVYESKWKRQQKKSLMCLLPDDDSLEQHIIETCQLFAAPP
jgi:hypothetical protein